jgi:hypothetical protein
MNLKTPGIYLLKNRLPHIILVFFLIDIGLCTAYIFNYMIGQPHWKITILLDLSDEASLSSWFSSVQLFCVFILSAIFSYYKIKHNPKAILLIFLPLIFLSMSIDESVQIHEWLGAMSDRLLPSGNREETSFQTTGIWMIVVGIPFILFFLYLTISIRKFLSDKISSLNKLVAGMVIMLIGALGLELLVNFIDRDYWFIEIAIEEGLEMVGVTIMLWAVYDMATDFIMITDEK